MKKTLRSLLVALILWAPSSAQELFTEIQASLVSNGPLYTFRVLGDRDSTAFSAYGILIISPDGNEQMVDQFDSFLPAGSEPDALIVEDLNFDGYSDLRIMKYSPGGANVNYYYWLYDPISSAFQNSTNFEILVSPEVDRINNEVLSRKKLSAREYLVEYYATNGSVLTLIRKDEKSYNADGSGILKRSKVNSDGIFEVVETRALAPGE